MAAENGETAANLASTNEPGAPGAVESKGKGKAAEEPTAEDTSMVEDDDDDDEEADEEVEAADEDGMEEIDVENVIGRRTRGKVIDFAKAAEENPPEGDDDEEDDEDFEVEDDKMEED